MLMRVTRTAQNTTGFELPGLQELDDQRCLRKSLRTIKDPTRPHNRLFTLLNAEITQQQSGEQLFSSGHKTP